LFSYNINWQILNNLYEIMKSVGEIISPDFLYQGGDLKIVFIQNNLDRVN